MCCIVYSLQAQIIEGKVYDARTRERVPGVVVYLDGTSNITTSDKDGNFKLTTEKALNTTLVFSHLSYELLTVENPYEHHEKAFFLQEKVSTISEAKVVADRYTRQEKMMVFINEFLGNSTAGKSCIIANDADIVLNYDSDTYTLSAYALRPVIIENRYLAYRITFDLQDFRVQYTENTLNMSKATSVFFKWSSFFIDQSPYNMMFTKRRETIYLRSSQYFFKNLCLNTLEETDFRIFNRFRRVQRDQYFIVADATPYKRVVIIPDTDINRRYPRVDKGTLFGVIAVTCSNRFRSDIAFLTNRFSVDDFGNIDAVDKVVFFGDMGNQRLGDMLPMDFVGVNQFSPPLPSK